MRAGAYTIHKSLTAEAAAVLKLALGLARRRGHAQVTPLHVAFALLTGPHLISSSASCVPGLLKRACLRSHPAPSHPLQCRALELCFNVALNRLPAASSAPCSSPPPPGSSSSFASSLIQPSPTLSNALVAALKRAQANQRRGCVELHPPTTPTTQQQQQQQPLLAIKVELDQLLVSILDDPSVSRVMREAGFSSATVKTNLEEEAALIPPPPPSSSSSPPPPPPHPNFFFHPDPVATSIAPWPPAPSSSCTDADVRAVLDVMLRHKQRSAVVVGDSASAAEAVAGDLLRRLEGGDDVAGAHLLRLQLSYVHVRLMSRADVDARAAELRRAVDAVRGGTMVVYVGDLGWAIDEESHAAGHYSPVEHMAAELGRLVDGLRAERRGRAWIVATASYQTYIRWQRQRRTRPGNDDDAWALQTVLVPTGGGTGLALNTLHHPSANPAAPAQLATVTMQMALPHPAAVFAERDGQQQAEKLVLCGECNKNYEREASMVKAEAGAADLPAWLLQPPAADHKDKYLMELKRKWSRLCRKLHLCSEPPCSAPPSCPWWSGPCMAGLLAWDGLMAHGESTRTPTGEWPPARWGLATSLREPGRQDVGVDGTALALASLPLSDARRRDPGASDGGGAEVERRLRRNIPWHPAAVAAEIAEAVAGGGGNGVWVYVKGGDHAAVCRAAAVIAETRCGAADRVVFADSSRFSSLTDVVARACDAGGGGRRNAFVLVLGCVERASPDVAECLVAASRTGVLKDRSSSGRELDLSGCVVILATSNLSTSDDEVIGLRIWAEDEDEASCGGREHKRKAGTEASPTTESNKRLRPRFDDVGGRGGLDLNVDLCADSDVEDEAIPSDITHEGSSDDELLDHPRSLFGSVACRVVTLADARPIRAHLHAMLGRGLGEQHQPPVAARVDDEAVDALAAAAGHFLEETLERWIAEVLQPAAATVRTGGGNGSVVVLGVGRVDAGAHRQTSGFMGSVLPSRVHVD